MSIFTLSDTHYNSSEREFLEASPTEKQRERRERQCSDTHRKPSLTGQAGEGPTLSAQWEKLVSSLSYIPGSLKGSGTGSTWKHWKYTEVGKGHIKSVLRGCLGGLCLRLRS